MTEAINAEAFASMQSRAADGPVTMLNLLKFKPGGDASYRRYAAATGPLLAKVGGHVASLGSGAELVIGRPHEDGWDLVLLVTYPSRGAFLQMIQSEEYKAIVHLRSEALERSVLLATDPFRF